MREATAVRDWNQLQARLSPIIGEDGFRVLFARSLHRARAEHPWLARAAAAEGDDRFVALKASLKAQKRGTAASGNRALAAHFSGLLNVLIGEELATRLLRQS